MGFKKKKWGCPSIGITEQKRTLSLTLRKNEDNFKMQFVWKQEEKLNFDNDTMCL